MNLSIVIPAYNCEASLPELVGRLHRTMEGLAIEYELILVNDGSLDRSWEVICDITRVHKWIRGINLMRNYGQHNALLCGIRAARFETIVTLDDDLQNPPEEIPRLLGKLAEGFDVVYGFPEEEQHGFWRDIGSKVTKLALQNAMGMEIARKVSAFRAFKTELRKAFSNYQSAYVCIDILLTWGTGKFAAIPVLQATRRRGRSNYTLTKLLTHAINMMTGFSVLPLQIASIMGLLCTAFGVGILILVISRYLLEGTSVPGFPFLACIIAIFSGAQLLSLGIIGEYLARIHFRSMNRPYCVVREEREGQVCWEEPETWNQNRPESNCHQLTKNVLASRPPGPQV